MNILARAFFLLSFATSFAQEKEIGNLIIENIPDIPSEIVESTAQYQNTRSAQLLDFSPQNGQILLSTRFGETNQLHVLKQSMGARKQITFFKEPVNYATYCPDKKYQGFIFLRDAGGNEFSQLFWHDENTGKQILLSDGGRSQNNLPTWSNQGNRFAYASTRRNQKDYDIYMAHMDNPKVSQLILEVSGSWKALDWSPDDKKLLLSKYTSINKVQLYQYELETKKLEEINPSEVDISYGDAAYSADGKGIFLTSDEGTEFQALKYYDLKSKKFKAITFSIKWDVGSFRLSAQRDKLAFTINQNGIDQLYLMTTNTMQFVAIDDLPKGVMSHIRFNPDGKFFGVTVSSPQSPGDIYVVNVLDKHVVRYTESETGGLDNSKFTTATLFNYDSFDDVNGVKRQIPAFIYRPNNGAKKHPVLVLIHGGPEGQSRPGFNAFITYLTNEMGIAVITPNVRGSAGYGKSYLKLDNGYKREESVQDIGKLLDWVTAQSDLDASRIAVMGGSYGGYMTLASMTHFNERLRCGIDVVGISNFVTFLKNTENYRKDLRRVEYGDEQIPEMHDFLQKISPLNNVDKITKPMLIVQGANDPRVPMSEAEQMKTKLREKGVETWYLLAKDEGHGFRKKSNVDFYQWSVIMFLQKHLLN